MSYYSLTVNQVTTGTTANTFATLLGLKMADTAGHRGRLRKLVVGGGGGAAQDLQVDIRIDRTGNTSDGTSTSVATSLILAHDQDGIASVVTAIGKTYTVEPTTFTADAGAGGSFNTRGVLVLEWGPGEGPGWGKNQTLCIRGTIGTGSTAATLTVSVEWEE